MRMECCKHISGDQLVFEAPTRHRENFAGYIFVPDWSAFLKLEVFLDRQEVTLHSCAIGRSGLGHAMVFLHHEITQPIGDDFSANTRQLSDRFLDLFYVAHDCCHAYWIGGGQCIREKWQLTGG
jgi:hypothetical protein